jgi:hypothetical protein
MRRGKLAGRLVGIIALIAVPLALAGTASAASPKVGKSQAATEGTTSSSSAFTLTPTIGATGTELTGYNQGFSVESADFAHGFLTKELLANWLRTLGRHGVIRVGGYSVDLIWPAFGADRNTPAPPQAIGGTVDQSDLDKLKELLDATGWKATIAVPLESVLNTTSDSSLTVAFSQAVAYAVAAEKTLGNDLQAIEIGNEYDIATSLTPAQYYTWMKKYYNAINTAVRGTHIKVIGPSDANSSATELGEFVSAVAADKTSDPRNMISAITAHYYDSGRCGLPVSGLMSADTYTYRQSTLQGFIDSIGQLHDGMPLVVDETNSESGSGCPDVSNTYASSLWSLDYLMQATELGIQDLNFHTSTAAVCGDYNTSPAGYTTSYRWYAAFCAPDQAALEANQLSATPLYYGIWAFHQIPVGRFVHLDLSSSDLTQLRAYGVESRNGELTVVLINVQDPSSAASANDSVTLNLPASYRGAGHAVTLKSSATGGLGSTDASAISLGGRTISSTGIASGTPLSTPVPADGSSANIDVAPGTAQIVTFPHVHLPGAVDVTGISASQPLTGGEANPFTVSVANTTSSPRTVTATVHVPSGWQAGSVTQIVPAAGRVNVTVPVTPPLAPSQATLSGQASAPNALAGGGSPSLDAVTAPPANAVSLALDAGCPTSPLYDGYQSLSPDDTFSADQGYGWVGAVPQCRDRGQPNALQQDLVASQSPATLGLVIPPGQHDIYVLVGDPSYAANPIMIASQGQVLAQTTTPLPAGQAQWLRLTVNGGSNGQTLDLTFSGQPGQYWVFDGLVVMP